jgi:hypothetical protein
MHRFLRLIDDGLLDENTTAAYMRLCPGLQAVNCGSQQVETGGEMARHGFMRSER